MNKGQIRAEHRKKRAELTSLEIQEKSEMIHQRFLDFLVKYPDIKHLHVFLSIERLKEIDSFPLIAILLDQGYQLYTSILDTESGELKTVYLKNLEDLTIDSWGIPVPSLADVAALDQIQLVLVPLLAYDQKGNRLGYGKGYYDGFLSKLDQEVMKVGVSFFEPVVKIDQEWHDIPLDLCITPQEVFFF
ncbi:5-formyltetrahydrofolate cyclo-ligase [Belliella buryatensis]|uniref:5-formyltetrahydrofolate cyclo-ligase n=1 Tax=Belliella buryatensis TaxID=1500549 RepID=A0A239DT48_9BACT|nr:5-formyltetrahydrofolate cyclo-ligase [Belliella buryatensis]SNS34724.1 5-formyltetrahydrofolate cyclo-ligase [Belliella buryatensis]